MEKHNLFALSSLVLISLYLGIFVLAQPTPPTTTTLPETQTVTITLKPGWNMISSLTGSPTPIEPVGYPELIYSNCARNPTKPVWYFNGSVQKWQSSAKDLDGLPRLTQLEPNKGYWVYVNNTCIVTQTGSRRPSSAYLDLYSGWNLISNPITGRFTPTDVLTVCQDKVDYGLAPPWHWNASIEDSDKWQSTFSYKGRPVIEYFNAGLGYYVYAKDRCDVRFEGGSVVGRTTTTTSGGSSGTGVSGSTTTTVSSGSGSTTTTLPPSTCHTSCEAAGDLGLISTSKETDTCQLPKGNYDFYKFSPGFSGTVKATVTPSTNNDLDIFVYNSTGDKEFSIACGATVCKSTAGGAGPESCTFGVANNYTYYVEVAAYDNSAYADKASSKLKIEKT